MFLFLYLCSLSFPFGIYFLPSIFQSKVYLSFIARPECHLHPRGPLLIPPFYLPFVVSWLPMYFICISEKTSTLLPGFSSYLFFLPLFSMFHITTPQILGSSLILQCFLLRPVPSPMLCIEQDLCRHEWNSNWGAWNDSLVLWFFLSVTFSVTWLFLYMSAYGNTSTPKVNGIYTFLSAGKTYTKNAQLILKQQMLF